MTDPRCFVTGLRNTELEFRVRTAFAITEALAYVYMIPTAAYDGNG